MTLKHFLLPCTLLLVFLSACAASASPTTPAPDKRGTPVPLPGDTAVLVWHREGGIAGFCDDLTVHADGSFKVSSCKTNERAGQLTAQQLEQLNSWVKTFKSFSVSEGEDATYPDAMILKATFTGAGTAQPSPEDIAAIHNFASLVVTQ